MSTAQAQAQAQTVTLNSPRNPNRANIPCARLSSDRYCVHLNKHQCERIRRRLHGSGASTAAAWDKCEACEINR